MWNAHNYTIVWTFFGIAVLQNWNKSWPFPFLWPLLSFPNFLACWVCVCVLVAQLCLTLCDSIDCSLPGSSVHGSCPGSSHPGKYNGVYKYSLLQRIFLTQELNLGLSHCRQILYWLSYQGRHIERSVLTMPSFRILNSSPGIRSPVLALFVVMLPKAYLASHSRMSSSRWMTTPWWLSGSLIPF